MASNILKQLDIPGSILFLGSGFSQSAKNIRSQNLPTGGGLRNEFAKILKVNSIDYDLKTLADEFASRKDLDLHQILYELFTVKELQQHQKYILGLPWRRIYTTNYDDAVEFAHSERGSKAASFNYDDAKPARLPNGSVIHLHGAIRSITEENVLDQLVLNENAYIRRHFENSPWYDDFERDLRFCSACFFLGYSLADYHIAALLMQNPTVSEKTYFVTRKTYDQLFANRVKPYGTILPIEVEGFAELCQKLPKPESVTDPYALKAFRYLDPFKDKKTLSPPTAVEVLNLVTYGTFNYQRCISTLPEAEYIVPRQELAENVVANVKNARCLLVHSRIGNGKSIFLHILAHKLSAQGYQCFWCRPNPLKLQQDLELLQKFKKPAIFFDSYNTAIDIIEHLAGALPDAKFIVAIRTAIQDVRMHEIQSRLPTPLHRVNLNGIQKEDANNFKKLLNQSGVRAPDLESVIDQCKDFREVVLALYNNKQIREKINSELAPLLEDQNFKKVFVVSHLLKWVGQDADAAFLRSVTHKDAYAEIAKFREIAGDVFRLDDDSIQVRSAMFSEYLIQNYLTTSDIIECVHPIIIEAVKRKSERRYQAILSSLIRFSALDRALSNDPHRLTSLVGLFDRLHRDIGVNQEPLFWLQYSILMTAANDLRAAEGFIMTAYERATASPGFQTFQLDTYALKLLLLVEQRAEGANKVRRFEEIIEKMDRMRSMIVDESRRFHSVQVLEGIEPFVAARISDFSTTEMNALVFHLSLLIENLDQLSPDNRAQIGSDHVKASVLRAKDLILRHSTA
jgi:hypothetical protein